MCIYVLISYIIKKVVLIYHVTVFFFIHFPQILRAADEDRDGFIDAKEIESGMNQADTLHSKGSLWNMYVDPVQVSMFLYIIVFIV
jgi:hypothetical protein